MADPVKIAQVISIDEHRLRARSTDALIVPKGRLTDTELVELEAVAVAPLPALPPCEDGHFAKCLRTMAAVLPRQNPDDTGAELFVAAYQRKLGHMPKAQISFIADKALDRCEWFPTIKECLEIAAGWERNDEALRIRGAARAAVLSEKQQRMEEVMARLEAGEMTQAELSGLPEKWQRIADARGLVLWSEDGFLIRPPRPLEGEGHGG